MRSTGSLPAIDFRHYNARWIERAAQIIFLNHTCYNGLFRVNRGGGFNVPFGRYNNPDILNADNLFEVAALLKNTRIIRGDFTRCRIRGRPHLRVLRSAVSAAESDLIVYLLFTGRFLRKGPGAPCEVLPGT